MKVFVLIVVILTFTGVCESKRRRAEYELKLEETSEYYPPGSDGVFGVGKNYPDETEHSSRSKRDVKVCSAADGCKKEVLRLPPGHNFFDIPFPPLIGEKERSVGINVTMKARVESIREIDEVKEEITLDMEITLGWTDWKILAHRRNMTEEEVIQFIKDGKHGEKAKNLITINNPEYLKSIWKPNLYIYNLIDKTQPRLMTDLITLKYDPDGGFIFYLTRCIK